MAVALGASVGIAAGSDESRAPGAAAAAACPMPVEYECVTGGMIRVTFTKAYKKALRKQKASIRAVGGGAKLKGRELTMPVVPSGSLLRGRPRSYVYEQGFEDEFGACQRYLGAFVAYTEGKLQLRQRIRDFSGQHVNKSTATPGVVAIDGMFGVEETLFKVWFRPWGQAQITGLGINGIPGDGILEDISQAAPEGGSHAQVRGIELRRPSWDDLIGFYFKSPRRVGTIDVDLEVQPKAGCE